MFRSLLSCKYVREFLVQDVLYLQKMQNYIISVFRDLREPLEWAAITAVPITHQLVEQRFGSEADPTDQVTDLEDKIHQVFAVLMQVTEGEANDIVCNSSGMGLEAWRKLSADGIP